MNTLTLSEAIARVNQATENPLGEMRVIDTMQPGQYFRQGDIYYVATDEPGTGAIIQDRKLAPGDTQGSRHTVGNSVVIRQHPRQGRVVQTPFGKFVQGPTIESADRFTISHPEHADGSLPAGCGMILYQYDPLRDQQVID